VSKDKRRFGIRHRGTANNLYAAGKLGVFCLEKLPPRRDIIEKSADVDFGAFGGTHLDNPEKPPAFYAHLVTERLTHTACGEHYLTHGSDTRECLATEAKRPDGIEIFLGTDFTRCVPLEGEERIVAAHSIAIVSDPDTARTAGFKVHHDRTRPGIEAVLDQFLECRSRSLDHFSGCNLVRQLLGQHPNLARCNH
jgi:hypothetical protein